MSQSQMLSFFITTTQVVFIAFSVDTRINPWGEDLCWLTTQVINERGSEVHSYQKTCAWNAPGSWEPLGYFFPCWWEETAKRDDTRGRAGSKHPSCTHTLWSMWCNGWAQRYQMLILSEHRLGASSVSTFAQGGDVRPLHSVWCLYSRQTNGLWQLHSYTFSVTFVFASAVCRVQPCSSRRLRRLGLWGPYPLISLFPFLPGACHFPPPSASPASSDSVSRVSETFPGTCSSVTTLSPLPLPLEMLLYLKTSICSCAFVRAPLAVCLRLCSHVNAPSGTEVTEIPCAHL